MVQTGTIRMMGLACISSGIHEIDPSSTLDSDEQQTWLSNGKPAFHQVIHQTIQYLRPFQIMARNRSDIKVLTKAAKLDGIKDYKTYTGHSIYAPTLCTMLKRR